MPTNPSSSPNRIGHLLVLAFGVLLFLDGVGGWFTFADTIALQNVTILLAALGVVVSVLAWEAYRGREVSRLSWWSLWVVVLAVLLLAGQEYLGGEGTVAGFYLALAALGAVGLGISRGRMLGSGFDAEEA